MEQRPGHLLAGLAIRLGGVVTHGEVLAGRGTEHDAVYLDLAHARRGPPLRVAADSSER